MELYEAPKSKFLFSTFQKLTFDGQRVAAMLLPAEEHLSRGNADKCSHLDKATYAMEQAHRAVKGLPGTAAATSRGSFTQITTGISHGIGRSRPMNVSIRSPAVAAATAELLSNPSIQKIAKSASSKPPQIKSYRR